MAIKQGKVPRLFAGKGVKYPTAKDFSACIDGVTSAEIALEIAESRLAKLETANRRPVNIDEARKLARAFSPELVSMHV